VGFEKNEAAVYLKKGILTNCPRKHELSETPALLSIGMEDVADFLLGSYSYDLLGSYSYETITSYESITHGIEPMPSYDSRSYDLSILNGL